MKLALGLGCDRGTPESTLADCIDAALASIGATRADVCRVASIDLKADEPGMLDLAHHHHWTIRFFAAQQLATVEVPNPSEVVRRYTGTPSVSEAAALLAAGTGQHNLLVEKHRLRGPDGRHATVSIARIPE